jgi:tRNA A-37 threonylcarbamoyl transferase component Bud32
VQQTQDVTGFDTDVRAALQPELEVLRPLGSGSSARVYLAREPALQRLVAVKVLKPELAADNVLRRRFEREAQSAARVSHPHVTGIYRIGRLAGDLPYMVQEYVDGRTVAEALAAGGPLAGEDARALLASVAAALAAVHDRGIVHRDVRAENVYLEHRTGRAVLGDFGIAALAEAGAAHAVKLTVAGQRLGVTGCMSPEHVRGEECTVQSDVYALGILGYNVLAGRGPYDVKGEAQLLVAHLQAAPVPLTRLRADVDPRMADLLQRCLAKDPRHRPLARDVAAALEQLRPGAPERPAAEQDAFGQFLQELKRRRVYHVLVAYATFAGFIVAFGEQIIQAFDVSQRTHQILISAILAGFPLSLVLSWIYDAGPGGIRRTRSAVPQSGRARAVMWGALVASALFAVLLGWLVLRQGAG